MTVRQYKIHTNLDSPDNIIYDVTNGKLRFYAPTNLGIVIANNIWVTNGVGVKGSSNLSHPDIEFQMETFGETLEENYRLVTDFVQDVLSRNFVTLEYTTDNFTVYADIALSEQTKTEGYGNNGTFSEKIVFNPITKWYTYDKLNFSTVENGDFNQDFSKIYGTRYKPNMANANLWKGTKEQVFVSTGTGSVTSYPLYFIDTDKTQMIGKNVTISYDYVITGSVGTWSGTIRPTYRFAGTNYAVSNTNLTGSVTQLVSNVTEAQVASDNYALNITGIPAGTMITIKNLKVEIGSVKTAWSPSVSESSGYVYSNEPSYTYFGESNVQRFSKWNIDKDIFSFVATIVPSNPAPSDLKFGLRFLDKDFNEYTAIVLEMETIPTNVQFNTDVNDEYYNAVIGSNTINQFSNLDFGRFRTRELQEGTMELIGVSAVEMSVKRKVDFI